MMEVQQYPTQNQVANNLVQPMVAPVPSLPGNDFFKFRIEGLDILEEIEHQLKGEVYNVEKRIYEEKFDRWINDDGINKVLHIIYSCGINKNTFLGNLTKEEIFFKCRMLKKKLALLFFKKYKDYQIKKEMRDLLIITIVNQVHSALSRSEEGKEAEQISTASQRHDIYQYGEEQEKRGLLQNIPFIGGRR